MADISEVKEDQIKDIFQNLEQLSGKLLHIQFLIDADSRCSSYPHSRVVLADSGMVLYDLTFYGETSLPSWVVSRR